MEKLLLQIAELLEVDHVELNDKLESFEVWDSFTIFTIIAMAQETYKIELSADEIMTSRTIGGLQDLIMSKM
jgi:acyl carrier protein